MIENNFVLPFLIGFAYLVVVMLARGISWVAGLSRIDKLRLIRSLISIRLLKSLKQAFMEGLIHRNIFRKNPVLGYMHMSLAFGWFLLIVVGHFEAIVAKKDIFIPMYVPIFFRYFVVSKEFHLSGLFTFLMDFLLLFVLSGLMLAITKRLYKSMFGMKKTTRLRLGDMVALGSLWFIFPLRLFAESLAAVEHSNGGFLTNTVGNALVGPINVSLVYEPAWWAYSVMLGVFFVMLPNSRYVHIPMEILFIFVKNAGVKVKKRLDTYTNIQVFSCSRCGICLDNCQMSDAGIRDTQSVYLLKSIRNKRIDDEHLFNCLLCGKCQRDCPVGIELSDLRITQRIESTMQYNSSYDYLKHDQSVSADVVYFAGCMTHLTPSVIKSMVEIFERCDERYWFMDKDKAPCCGRPLMLAGQYDAAAKLIGNNIEKIIESGAKTLVVSCPICYKVFREDYHLNGIDVVFHVDYILSQIKNGKLELARLPVQAIYHDPCELGRGCNTYEQPRKLLSLSSSIISVKNERENAYCCGGSLANLKIRSEERAKIRKLAMTEYQKYSPDMLVTACPMCKKTFARDRSIPVLDISEVVIKAIHAAEKGRKEVLAEGVTESEVSV